MRYANLIKISVFSYEKDNEQQIHDKFLNLISFDIEKEKIELKTTFAKGFNEKKITIYEIALTKQRHTSIFLKNLIKNIDEGQIKQILSQLDDKLDAKDGAVLLARVPAVWVNAEQALEARGEVVEEVDHVECRLDVDVGMDVLKMQHERRQYEAKDKLKQRRHTSHEAHVHFTLRQEGLSIDSPRHRWSDGRHEHNGVGHELAMDNAFARGAHAKGGDLLDERQ